MSLHGIDGGSSHLTIAAPNAGPIGPGAYTVAVLHMPNVFSSCFVWKAYQADNYSFRGLYLDGDMWVPDQQADINIPSFANPAEWYWVVVTKSAATETPRAHYATYSSSGAMTWVHMNALSTQNPRSQINRFSIADEFGTAYRGHVACLTAFTSMMSDAEIESAFVRDSASIMALNPQFFVHWPSVDGISSPFVDLAGGGVETIRSGSWEVSADPPNFNFSLSRTGKPKIWNGSEWVSHQAKVWNGSTWNPHPIAGHNGTDFIHSK